MSKKEEVLFEPFPKQEEFMEAVLSQKYSIVLYGGAIRGGKTFAALATAIILCKIYPGSRWIVVRDSLTTLKRNTIPSFQKLMPSNFLESHNQQNQLVTCTNGSQIMFLGENYDSDKELDRFKGLEANGFILEEVNEIREETFMKCIERAGSWIIKDGKQPDPIVMATCNPTQNWVKRRFYDKWKNKTLPKGWLYIPSKIFDNPHIPESYIENLKNMDPFQYQVFVNGDWEIQPKTGHEFYKRFDTEKHVRPVRYNENLAIHLTLDFNVNPYITMLVSQLYKDKKGIWELRVIKEYCLSTPDNTVYALAKEFRNDFPLHVNGLFYYGDPSGKQKDTRTKGGGNDYTILHNELKDYHPQDRVLRTAPKVTARGNFINDILSEKVQGIRVVIDKSCYNTIKDFINLKEDADGTKLKERERDAKTGITFEKIGHTSDAFDYQIVKMFEREYKRFVGKRRKLLS